MSDLVRNPKDRFFSSHGSDSGEKFMVIWHNNCNIRDNLLYIER